MKRWIVGRWSRARSSEMTYPSRSRSIAMLAAVVRVDLHVVVGKIAGPHRGRLDTAAERHAHRDLLAFHRLLALGLGITRGAAAILDHVHGAQVQPHARGIQVRDTRIANRG